MRYMNFSKKYFWVSRKTDIRFLNFRQFTKDFGQRTPFQPNKLNSNPSLVFFSFVKEPVSFPFQTCPYKYLTHKNSSHDFDNKLVWFAKIGRRISDNWGNWQLTRVDFLAHSNWYHLEVKAIISIS